MCLSREHQPACIHECRRTPPRGTTPPPIRCHDDGASVVISYVLCIFPQREVPMKKLIAASAGLLLLAGMSAASAQGAGTPGAGSPGQDQRGDTGEGPGGMKTPGTP